MTVIYLHGFASSPKSRKAQFFSERFKGAGIECVVPDLEQGNFRDLTLTGQLRVVERAAAGGSVTLIGSSMGGYLAALYAARHQQVEKVIALAGAFDFAARWRERLGERQMAEWREKGAIETFHYGSGRPEMIAYSLYTDALNYEPFPAVSQPTLLLHGLRDDVVPVDAAKQFLLKNPQAELVTFDSGHELTDQLDRLWRHTASFLNINL
ncbi:MAG: alpha/beta fold hydrolase [Bryobacterales bacterium]|nr:alpha/beta fold hydrolase [Bryobacterales bacterium]